MSFHEQSQRLTFGSTPIDFCEPDDAAAAIASRQLTGAIHLCNAYTVALAEEHPELAAALATGDANFPDGTPLVWWARRQGVTTSGRVYGPTLMQAVLDRGRTDGLRHYLYGSTDEVLQALTSKIEERWPGAAVVGIESPPFRDLSDDEVRASVATAMEAGADVVWVGMGTPKQDLLVAQMAQHGDAAFVAIGAAFDFIAGTKPQAPAWLQRLGLEWLFRLASEPRRLWKRYLVYNTKFLRLAWRHRRT